MVLHSKQIRGRKSMFPANVPGAMATAFFAWPCLPSDASHGHEDVAMPPDYPL